MAPTTLHDIKIHDLMATAEKQNSKSEILNNIKFLHPHLNPLPSRERNIVLPPWRERVRGRDFTG
jgi:hypothetical protein